nr:MULTISPECIES: glucose 1-dehydrogenase [unclassified Streptomyces]
MVATSPARKELDGKVIMITGASSGIGAAAAQVMAAQGAAVMLMARREERLLKVAAEISAAGGVAEVTVGDVTRPADVARAVARTVSAYGGLDAAFNNAGWGSAGTPLHETDDRDYDHIMEVNVRGVWNCLRQQIPVMLRQSSGGAIVNTSSTAGRFATGASAPYVAAKHAVLGMTRAAAAEYGDRGIRVNALIVGSTRTDLLTGTFDKAQLREEHATARAIMHRLADPTEIAEAAAWLCSDRSSFVTGADVPVDGGCVAV